MVAVLNFRRYRRAMAAYAHQHGLASEDGFNPNGLGPLRRPGRRFLVRLQKNLIARHIHGVTVSGVLDKATRAALDPPATLGDKAVKMALTQLGVHEDPWGSNRGRQVDNYEALLRIAGAPWCACFVSWCYRRVGYVGRISASAYAFLNIGQPVTLGNALPGDPVVFHIGEGHIGIFLSHHDGMVRTIDGNTSDQVAIRDRPYGQVAGIRRLH